MQYKWFKMILQFTIKPGVVDFLITTALCFVIVSTVSMVTTGLVSLCNDAGLQHCLSVTWDLHWNHNHKQYLDINTILSIFPVNWSIVYQFQTARPRYISNRKNIMVMEFKILSLKKKEEFLFKESHLFYWGNNLNKTHENGIAVWNLIFLRIHSTKIANIFRK